MTYTTYKDYIEYLPGCLLENLENNRLIFTMTTGRSGTGYLAKMLDKIPEVAAFHEPHPKFSDFLREVQKDSDIALHFWILRKLPSIAQTPENIYIETSHLFGKGFLESLIGIGIIPDIIILKRDFRKVASSLYELNVIPGRTQEGLKFLLHPDDPEVIPVNNWENLNDYQLCYWYCLEMERRMKKYTKLITELGGKVIQSRNIFYKDNLTKLLKQLDLEKYQSLLEDEYFQQSHQKVNTKDNLKRRNVHSDFENLDKLEEQVLGMLAEHVEC